MQHWEQDAQGWDPFLFKHQRHIKGRENDKHTHTHIYTLSVSYWVAESHHI